VERLLVNSKWEQDNPETAVDETQIDIPAVTDAKNKHPGRNGFRSAHLLWYFPAANCQWSTSPTAVDSGELSTILPSGLLQRGYCAQLAPGLAGFDRPELYVDPWGVNPSDPSKQRIYVSTFCGRCKHPPCAVMQGALDDDNVQVYTSLDSGATWKAGMRLDPPQPMAMTSTPPNGRLFMFQIENGDGAASSVSSLRLPRPGPKRKKCPEPKRQQLRHSNQAERRYEKGPSLARPLLFDLIGKVFSKD
jgi:hypothetical protein